MAKVNVDWNNLGFAYQPISQRYVANFKDGKWGEGHLTDDANVTINECAGILQYCQEVFEGLKAYKTKDGRVVTFRPDMNAKRMIDSAKRLEMPPVSEEMFLEAVDQVVAANKDWIPPYESGGALYLRPYLFATGPVIGVKPSDEYQFRLFGTPVGSYFKNGVKPITICVSDYDRAAPHGTGNIKAGLNYAMSLYPYILAHQRGFDENMYLDAATRTYVEETGGANFLFVTKDGKLVTPKSDGRASSGQVHGTQGLCRSRPLRHGCCHLPGRQGCRQRRDDRVPERHEGNGSCTHETLQHAAWHSARHGRSTGKRLDSRNQVRKGMSLCWPGCYGSQAFYFISSKNFRQSQGFCG